MKITNLLKKKKEQKQNLLQKKEGIKNKELESAIIQAQGKEGYLICLTELEGEKLNHKTWTKNFKHGDIVSSLEEWHSLLKKEINKNEK